MNDVEIWDEEIRIASDFIYRGNHPRGLVNNESVVRAIRFLNSIAVKPKRPEKSLVDWAKEGF